MYGLPTEHENEVVFSITGGSGGTIFNFSNSKLFFTHKKTKLQFLRCFKNLSFYRYRMVDIRKGDLCISALLRQN